MSILDDLATPPKKKVSIAEWVEQQPADHAAKIREAAVSPDWSTFALETILRKWGAVCSQRSVEKWRLELGLKR